MLNRAIRISTIAFGILCAIIVLCTGVFAATRQSTTINTTVEFTPSLLAIVTVNVNNQGEQVIFNNTDETKLNGQNIVTSPNFVVSGTPTGLTSSNEIVIKVYNYTQNANITTANISLVDPKGAYLEQNNAETNQVVITTPISYKSGSTVSSGQSPSFHIVSLYSDLNLTLKIALVSTPINS